jgi:hypothetical protein
MDRLEARRRYEEIIRNAIPLSQWPTNLSLTQVVEQIMIVHDESVEAALSFDEAEAQGLDGTGRDGHLNFPHRR